MVGWTVPARRLSRRDPHDSGMETQRTKSNNDSTPHHHCHQRRRQCHWAVPSDGAGKFHHRPGVGHCRH